MGRYLEGLAGLLLVAACSPDKPAENPASTTVAATDTTDTTVTAPAATDVPAQDPAPGDTRSTEEERAAERRRAATTATTAGATDREVTSETRPEPSRAEPSEPVTPPTPPKPDNTKVNERDKSGAMTPIDQGENETDLKVTQQIRRAVMSDSSLSFTAKNVKIITVNRKVTLRGPVKTAAERASIEAAARKVAGEGMVVSQLEVIQ